MGVPVVVLNTGFRPVRQARVELREDRRAMIFHRDHHRAQHPIRDVGGPGNEEEIATGHRKLLRLGCADLPHLTGESSSAMPG